MAKIENRLKFLAEKYNIFLGEEIEDIITQLTEDGHEVTKVETANATMVGVSDDTIYAILDSVVSKTSEYVAVSPCIPAVSTASKFIREPAAGVTVALRSSNQPDPGLALRVTAVLTPSSRRVISKSPEPLVPTLSLKSLKVYA